MMRRPPSSPLFPSTTLSRSLLDLVREPLQRGVVVAGEVRDAPALAAALAHLFNTHRLPKKAVRLGISNNRIGVRIIEVSGVMNAGQLEHAIRFQIGRAQG